MFVWKTSTKGAISKAEALSTNPLPSAQTGLCVPVRVHQSATQIGILINQFSPRPLIENNISYMPKCKSYFKYFRCSDY